MFTFNYEDEDCKKNVKVPLNLLNNAFHKNNTISAKTFESLRPQYFSRNNLSQMPVTLSAAFWPNAHFR